SVSRFCRARRVRQGCWAPVSAPWPSSAPQAAIAAPPHARQARAGCVEAEINVEVEIDVTRAPPSGLTHCPKNNHCSSSWYLRGADFHGNFPPEAGLASYRKSDSQSIYATATTKQRTPHPRAPDAF